MVSTPKKENSFNIANHNVSESIPNLSNSDNLQLNETAMSPTSGNSTAASTGGKDLSGTTNGSNTVADKFSSISNKSPTTLSTIQTPTSSSSSNTSPTRSSSHDQPQKIGSYRSRAGKLSNTLSNLLPSISARLHHSKKIPIEKPVGLESSRPSLRSNGSSLSNNSFRREPSIGRNSAASINNDFYDNDLTFTQDMEGLINFPDSANLLMSQNSADIPLRASRTRNDTITSQITSLSMNTAFAGSSSAIWSNHPNDAMQHPMSQQYNTNLLQPVTSNPLYSPNKNFQGTNNNNNNNNNNTAYQNRLMPTTSWDNYNTNNNYNNNMHRSSHEFDNRQRSKSSASHLHPDSALHEQLQRHRATSLSSTTQTDIPLVADEIELDSINWVTMDYSAPSINQITNLLPTNTISLSNIFPLQQQHSNFANAINLTSTSLVTLCSKYGNVLSARTLKMINMALVEFSTIDSAMRALEDLQDKEVSKIGAPSIVAFAKILPNQAQQHQSKHYSSASMGNSSYSLLQEQLMSGSFTIQQQGNISVPIINVQPQSNYHSHHKLQQPQHVSHSSIHISSNEKEPCPFTLPPPTFQEEEALLHSIIASFDANHDASQSNYLIKEAMMNSGTTDTLNFGPLPENLPNKEFDAPKLRELRKLIDAKQLSGVEMEQLAMAMLDQLPELCSDYLGNTIVQKLFSHSSDIIKDIMLRKTAKYLTSMGVHKNGTWACQKIISKANTSRQMMLVAKGIENYCTPLFNDQFGNYVIQCVLKFGFPWNNFIFKNIIANFWIIVQNRYGSRAIRACLEAQNIITLEQTIVLSAMIVSYAEYLITNTNGTLLVTWFLDTCDLKNRHYILAQKLIQNIEELCCHKLASLTVLKMLSYRGDDVTKNLILDEIFGDNEDDAPPFVLKRILCDHNNGPSFIYKILSMPLLEGEVRSKVIVQVRKVLLEASPAQIHRRLMEEVNLTPLNSQSPGNTPRHQAHNSTTHNESARHMSHLSTSSVRSNSSRQNVQLQNTLPPQQPMQMAMNYIPATNLHNNESNFIFPGSFPTNTDELTSQFDNFNLSPQNQNYGNVPNLSHIQQNSNSISILSPTKNPDYNNRNSDTIMLVPLNYEQQS